MSESIKLARVHTHHTSAFCSSLIEHPSLAIELNEFRLIERSEKKFSPKIFPANVESRLGNPS